MMKVTLVGITHDWRYDVGRRDRCLAPAILKAYAEAQLGLKDEVSIKAEDYQLSGSDDFAFRRVADSILVDEPALVGFSCYMWNVTHIFTLCRMLKAAAPRLKIVLGGPEVTTRSEVLLDEHPSVDFICFEEEGEQVFAELLVRCLRGEGVAGVRGLVWRDGGTIVREPSMPLLSDLNVIPSPYLTNVLSIRDGDTVVVEASRGCPYGCKFCDYPRGTTRDFSVERVLAEIRAAQSQAKNLIFFFADADPFTDISRAKELVRGVRRLGEGRPDLFLIPAYLARLDAETLELMNTENFVLCAGVQSTNAGVLKSVARFFSKEKLERGVRMWREKAPRCSLNFHLIFGLPGETIESFRDGLQWALDLRISQLWLFRISVLPSTELGRNPGSFGLVAEKLPPYRVLSTAAASADELNAFECWSCVFRILNDLRRISDLMAWLSVENGVKSLALWDELIAEALHVPDFGFEQIYRDADPFDNGFSLAAKRWIRDARESGVIDRMHAFAFEFAKRKLAEAGNEASAPALSGF